MRKNNRYNDGPLNLIWQGFTIPKPQSWVAGEGIQVTARPNYTCLHRSFDD